jgi:hypothetical protein
MSADQRGGESSALPGQKFALSALAWKWEIPFRTAGNEGVPLQ